MESLIYYDQQIFFFINRQLSNPAFDFIMPYVRERDFWIPLYVLLVFYFVRLLKKWSWVALVTTAITIVITDQLSSSLIKPWIGRLRPCNDPSLAEQVQLIVNCGSGFSFVSSHAANHFGIACFLIVMLQHRLKWILPVALFWAALVSFAQVYVGVHYPLDVICGGLLGVAIGILAGKICKGILIKHNPQVFA